MNKISLLHHSCRHIRTRLLAPLDLWLCLNCFALACVGLLSIYSASIHTQEPLFFKQCIRIVIGFGVMLIAAHIRPHIWYRVAPWIYFGSLLLLCCVSILGYTGKGAQRWLNLGLIRFEPSELMKIGLPMILAWWLHQHTSPPQSKQVLIALLIITCPVLLILKQPDLGTAILLSTSGLSILFLSGVSWRWITGFFITVCTTIPFAWHHLHGYQKQRILMFLNPEKDPLGHGYHIIQSKIAIGSGGLWGKGWMMSTQAHLQFLPEHATDFIFALWAEEFGFLGTLILFSVITLLIIRLLIITLKAQNTYRRLLSASITMMFSVACFVNIGMVCGILPVVGVPLTLISFGGTSMVTMMAAFGMMMSLHAHRNLMTH